MIALFLWKPSPPSRPKPRVIVYIDGFNLYYGAVRATPALKWLDLESYCKHLRPHDEIVSIRYFSALVDGPLGSRRTWGRARTGTRLQIGSSRNCATSATSSALNIRRQICRTTLRTQFHTPSANARPAQPQFGVYLRSAAGQPTRAEFVQHLTLSHASPCGQSMTLRHHANLNSCVLN